MKKNIFIIAVVALSSLLLTGCTKEFAELNKSKTAVSTPNASQLFYESVVKFEPQGYLEWYYNAPMMYRWAQWGVPTGGFSAGFTSTSETGDKGSKSIDVLRYANEIKHYIDGLESEDDKATNLPYYYASKVLAIYLGIFDTDVYGSRPYTEAASYLYGGTLTPKYDTQEELFSTWLAELDEAITCFTASGAALSGSQDVVFNGNVSKWAKFANSLKLRIAVRLLAQNKAQAQKIAGEVVAASCGYIDSVDDDVLFNKATLSSESDDVIYHWNNGFMTGIGANGSVVDFMVNNLDPRVRFCYTKNQWSSKIIKAYYERGKEIPDFIEKDVDYTEVDGKKTFNGFKAPGEPWVRYHGLPAAFDVEDRRILRIVQNNLPDGA